MKKSKYSESQIIKILGEQEKGKTVNEICREHGISQPSLPFINGKADILAWMSISSN